MSSKQEIISQWQHFGWEKKLKAALGYKAELVEDQITCLKNSREKTSIWKLEFRKGKVSTPIVLKIYKPPLKENLKVEIKMYRKGSLLFHEYMPQVYWLESNVIDGQKWLFSEYVQPLHGQIRLVPKHLDQIIPTVAKFHAYTYKDAFSQHKDLFASWLPRYDSKIMNTERIQHIEKTKEYLDLAMKDTNLRELVQPNYQALQTILQKGPLFFPEIMEDGQSLIHGDLHTHNICCENVSKDGPWQIRFIDWESAKYAPCWYDLVVLVELLIDFRKDWHKNADEIRSHCVQVYSQEMERQGVTFHTDPLQLLKMTYLQRTLEKRLLNHLRRTLNGEQSALLGRYLEKIRIWGKELGLY